MSWEESVAWLRSQPDKQALVFACYFDDPIESAADRFCRSEEFNEVLKLASLSTNSKVLDLGSGRGISAYAFARHGHQVTALEPDSSNLVGRGAIEQLSQVSGLPIRISQASAEEIDSADDFFDLVYCRAALHHARSLEDLCKEVYRVLKPGGMFIASREHVIGAESELAAFLASHPLHSLYGGEMAYTLKTYQKGIVGSGLGVKKVFGPRQSVINGFPKTTSEIDTEVIDFLSRRLGLPGRLLGKTASVRKATTVWLDHRDRQPGRLYTFVAQKPR